MFREVRGRPTEWGLMDRVAGGFYNDTFVVIVKCWIPQVTFLFYSSFPPSFFTMTQNELNETFDGKKITDLPTKAEIAPSPSLYPLFLFNTPSSFPLFYPWGQVRRVDDVSAGAIGGCDETLDLLGLNWERAAWLQENDLTNRSEHFRPRTIPFRLF